MKQTLDASSVVGGAGAVDGAGYAVGRVGLEADGLSLALGAFIELPMADSCDS